MTAAKVIATTLEVVGNGHNKFYRVYDIEGSQDVTQYGRQDKAGGRRGGQWGIGSAATVLTRKRREGYKDVNEVEFRIDLRYYDASPNKNEFLETNLIAAARTQNIDLNAGINIDGRYRSPSTPGPLSALNNTIETLSGVNSQDAPVDRFTAFSEACLDAIVAQGEGNRDAAVIAYGELADELEALEAEFAAMRNYYRTLETVIQAID